MLRKWCRMGSRVVPYVLSDLLIGVKLGVVLFHLV